MNRPTVPVLPTEATVMAAALRAHGSVRVGLDALWRLWAAAAPRLVGSAVQAEGLSAVLTELAGDGVITLPVGAWDTSTVPALPQWVAVPEARRARRDRAWTRFPWRAEMGWAASLTDLSDDRFRDLVAINDWLVRTEGMGVPIVPVRYRSVELFGDEKHIDAMERTRLFGASRLSYKLLRCRRIPAPLPAAIVGAGPDVLVVENSDTYWVAVEAMLAARGHPVGVVAWGSGRTFPSQVATLTIDVAGRGPSNGAIWYWGDFDPAGVTTAMEAAEAGDARGLSIRPAIGLWSAMADRPIQNAGSIRWPPGLGQDWLGSLLWERLSHIREASGRVAEESVPHSAITDWAAGLAEPTSTELS